MAKKINPYVERAKRLVHDHLKIFDYKSGVDAERGKFEQVRMRQHGGRKAFVLTNYIEMEADEFLKTSLKQGMFINEKANKFDVKPASKLEAEEFLCGLDPRKNELYVYSPLKQKASEEEIIKHRKEARAMMTRMAEKAWDIRSSRSN